MYSLSIPTIKYYHITIVWKTSVLLKSRGVNIRGVLIL